MSNLKSLLTVLIILSFVLPALAHDCELIQTDLHIGLGMFCYEGQDYICAIKYFTEAANSGSAEAQYMTCMMHIRGEGTSMNKAKSFEWITKAANQGHSASQNLVGAVYYHGDESLSVPQDYNKAFEWISKAAIQGDSYTQSGLGEMYATGKGVLKDEVMGCAWMYLSKDVGNSDTSPRAGGADKNLYSVVAQNEAD